MSNLLKLYGNSQSSTLKLHGNQLSLLNFDGSTSITFNPGIDISANRTVTFKLWLDATSGFIGSDKVGILNFRNEDLSVRNNSLVMLIDGSVLQVHPGGSSGNSYKFHLLPINTLLNFEVNKEPGTITSVKVNGVDMEFNATLSTTQTSAASMIGDMGGASLLSLSTIWDVKVYNTDTQTLLHHFPGYPYGNTISAWNDIVGDVSVNEISENATLRTLPISVAGIPGNGNKLLLNKLGDYSIEAKNLFARMTGTLSNKAEFSSVEDFLSTLPIQDVSIINKDDQGEDEQGEDEQ